VTPDPSSAPSVRAEDVEAQRTAARSALYSLLSRCLAVPDEAFHASLTDGSLAREFSVVIAALPYPLAGPEPAPPGIPGFIELQSGYIAFFEVGPKGPACPLYEGSFRNDRGRKAVMEGLLRFYHHFGLKLSERARELPDHLSAELEFMHYLSFLEAGIRARGAEGWKDMVLAQRDFLERHLAAWTPELARRAGKRGAPPVQGPMLTFLNAFVRADLNHLKETGEC
jgi:DMSO reductase family type II enzyme chaperone